MQIQSDFVLIYCAGCGISFAIARDLNNRLIENHHTFYCPSGHENYYPKQSQAEIAKQEAQKAKDEADRLRKCIEHKKEIIRTKEYQVRHYKGELTKIKKVKK